MVKPGLINFLYTKINTIHYRIDHSGKKGHPSNFDLSLLRHEIWENERDGKETVILLPSWSTLYIASSKCKLS